MDWVTLVSVTALLVALGSVTVAALLARQSPPAAINRAAARVRELAEDTELRVAGIERRQRELEQAVESQLDELEALGKKASQRFAKARRSEQAAGVAAGNGVAGGWEQYQPGSPERRAVLERMFGGG